MNHLHRLFDGKCLSLLAFVNLIIVSTAFCQTNRELGLFSEANSITSTSLEVTAHAYRTGLYQINFETLVIDIEYENIGDTPVYIWLKNWRIIMLSDEESYFENYLGENAWVNYLVFTKKYLNLENQTRLSHDYIVVMLNSSYHSIKEIKPKGTFCISLIIEDSNIVNSLMGSEYYLNILGCIRNFALPDTASNSSEWGEVLFQRDRLLLMNIPIEYNESLRGGGIYELKYYPEKGGRPRFPDFVDNSFFRNLLFREVDLLPSE